MASLRLLSLLIATIGLLGSLTSVALGDDVACDNGAIVKSADLCRFFQHYERDDKPKDPRVLSQLGITADKTSRSMAIVVAIDHYAMEGADLPPAKIDGDNLERFLIDNQHFDEVVVLRNEDATKENIEYFLADYVNAQYALYQGRTRILFAYSGHGTQNPDVGKASLVLSAATSSADLPNLLPLSELNEKLHQVAQYNFQLLTLINACYGGDLFQSAQEGGNPFISSAKGAHALTAGSPDELVWSLPGTTSGSIFFDALIKGIESGDADKSNHVLVSDQQGRTFVVPVYIVRLGSLLQYLTEKIMDLGVNPETKKSYGFPWLGSVNVSGEPSVGAFFFLGPQNDEVAQAAAANNPEATLLASAGDIKTNLGASFSFESGAINSLPSHPEIKVFNPPEDYSIQGVDISQYNKIDWSKVSAKEIGFLYVRSTDISGIDTKFQSNWKEAGKKGIVRGAYHYFGMCEDPQKQYQRIVATVSLGEGDLPIAVDVDWPPILPKQKECAAKLGKDKVARRVLSLVDLLSIHYGRQPVLYGSQNVFNDLLMGREQNFTIWLGEREKPTPEAKLGGSKPWSFWQYTAQKRPTGFSTGTDASVFFGTRQEFSNFLAGNENAIRQR